MTTYVLDASNGFGIDAMNADGDLIDGHEMMSAGEATDFVMNTEGDVEFYLDGMGVDGSIARDVDETLDILASLPE